MPGVVGAGQGLDRVCLRMSRICSMVRWVDFIPMVTREVEIEFIVLTRMLLKVKRC